jgi:hypothetical protein
MGYIQALLSESDLAPIKKEIYDIKNDFENHKDLDTRKTLAGQLEKEYSLINIHDYMEKLLLPYAYAYDKEFDFVKFYNTNVVRKPPLCLMKSWVNFQKKYEYNPAHVHDGILSFVLYIDIPYKIEDERKLGPGSGSNSPDSGCFHFHYNSSMGFLMRKTIDTDITMNNTLIMFPAALTHSVSPFFSSDEYRISVSGNFCYKPD